MSGLEPDTVRTRAKSRRPSAGARNETVERADLRPVVLVPTPAQLAAGIRVIDAEPEIWPGAVIAMVKRAAAGGWQWRVTYSQFLDIPPVSGKNVSKWVTKHCLRVRTWRTGLGVEGSWVGTEEDGWKPETAQAYRVGWGLSRPFGVTQMAEVLNGTMVLARDERGFAYVAQAG